MRIPVAESDVGYWYPIGDKYYFVLEITDRLGGYYKKYRSSTFAEFKKEFPYLAYPNSSCVYRSRTKYK